MLTAEISKFVSSENDVIVAVFPNAPIVLYKFLERIYDETVDNLEIHILIEGFVIEVIRFLINSFYSFS